MRREINSFVFLFARTNLLETVTEQRNGLIVVEPESKRR